MDSQHFLFTFVPRNRCSDGEYLSKDRLILITVFNSDSMENVRKDIVVILDNGHGRDTIGKCSPDKRLMEY